MGNAFYRKSLKSFVLLLLVAVLALPGMSAAATKEQEDALDYLNQIEAISKYSSTALKAYNANLYYNSQNRKAMYSLYVKTIIPNFTKYANGLKKIKPKNKELTRLHKIYVQAIELELKGFTQMQNAISKAPGDGKAFDKGKATLAKGQALQKQFNSEMDKYASAVKWRALAEEPETITLPLDFDADEISERMVPQMSKLYKAFASAFPAGNTAQTDKLLRAWIAPKNEDNTLLGPDYSIDRLNEGTAGTIRISDAAVLKGWAKAIKATSMGDVTVRYFKPSATDFAFTFNLAVEGYTDESTPSFTVVFHNTGEQYEIKEIYHSY